MGNLLRFLVLSSLKILARTFYIFEITWVGNPPPKPFKNARIAVVLNHTSLFEPIYLAAIPFSALWDIAKRGVLPGADITINRPILGRFFKALAPQVISLTRKRDETWKNFLSSLKPNSLILIAPEGRMKRPTGLDKDGKPMTVRGGIADILLALGDGRMIIAYAGGLHHIQVPGKRSFRIFQRVKIAFESLDIADYRRDLGTFSDRKRFIQATVLDLEARRDKHCPMK
jgi:1-acyl-sn-glycerol-3-phosphate acyltransferase